MKKIEPVEGDSYVTKYVTSEISKGNNRDCDNTDKELITAFYFA